MGIVWHMFELVFINTLDGGPFVDDYMEWLNLNYPAPSTEEGEEIGLSIDPTAHDSYWPYIITCVLRGHWTVAERLLKPLVAKMTSQEDKLAVSAAIDLLYTVPRLNQYQDGSYQHRAQPQPYPSVAHFMADWQAWKQKCEEWSVQTFASPLLTQLTELFAILAGDFATINSHAHNWQEALGGILLFGNPIADVRDAASFLVDCEGLHGDHNGSLEDTDDTAPARRSHVEQVVLAFFQYDLGSAIRYCSYIDLWLATHLVDCLDKLGHLHEIYENLQTDMREYLVLAYGEMLMAHPSFWQVGAQYLASAPAKGLSLMEEYLTRLPLTSERKAGKVLGLLKRYGLIHAYRQVCRCLARQYLDRRAYGSAISYYIEAGEPRRVGHIVDLLLQDYIHTGELTYQSIIDNLGVEVNYSDKLQFLSQYRDFHEMYKQKDFVQAGKLLVRLLTSNMAPKAFWHILLVDAIPLLEGDLLVFDVHETHELMRCLEEITSSHMRQTYLTTFSPLWFKIAANASNSTPNDTAVSEDAALTVTANQQLDVIRMALVRNLARATLFQ
ncbi:Nucleoporin nup85 [Dimargaris verticillata]|uniref:Nuclear pore complex protein Nup85 n=1 Tax=Dimargaris verticillata TaxID=2761393 RepID=A0A9W8E789_9FUNG|nr:Nucleoporin nup85 [Dimargaris verticillata]